jgi:AcrR family transcriptional regulator
MAAGTADRIIEAARAIVTEEGAEAVSMRRVATAAGITPMAIYRHFADRGALLRAVADDLGAQLRELWVAPDPDADPETLVREQLRRFLDFALGRPRLYRFLMIDGWARARRYPQDFRESEGPAFARIVDLVADLMARGDWRPDDPTEVALSLTAQTQGLVQLYLSGRMDMSENEFRALCERALWRMIHGVAAGHGNGPDAPADRDD